MDRPITEPPPPGRAAAFAPGFGTRSLLTVDTEEEFDWSGPFTRDRHGLTHLAGIPRFQEFCEGLGVVPVYLIDWPVATSAHAIEVIGSAVKAGRAEVGIQLHPWVNPPFEEEVNPHNSYAGNLPPALERAKFLALRDAIAENFGTPPLIYRAGRYGLGPATAGLLREAGVPVDSSVRANFDYRAGHGPDYSRHPLSPYWVDDDRQAARTAADVGVLGHAPAAGRSAPSAALARAAGERGAVAARAARKDRADPRGGDRRGSDARDRHGARRPPAAAGV